MASALIIDCHNVGWQSAYAYTGMSHNNMPTGVIFGFLRAIVTAGAYINPDYVLFAWDSKKSRRKLLYSDYKLDRYTSIAEEDIIRQRDTLRQLELLRTNILPAIGLCNNFKHTGFEADDIMASLVIQHDFDECLVVSTDADMYQIITDAVSIYNNRTHTVIDKNTFIQMYNGLTPDKWADVKALAGCSSDNVPGIKGIGEASAIKYLLGDLFKGKKYQDIELALHTEEYKRDKTLVTLPLRQLDYELTVDTVKTRNFINVCKQYNMLSFLRRDTMSAWKRTLNML